MAEYIYKSDNEFQSEETLRASDIKHRAPKAHKTFEGLKMDVVQWAKDRDIATAESLYPQFIKVLEEVSEIGTAINMGNEAELQDAIGDTLVTLIILSEQAGLNVVGCLAEAFWVIEKRKGKTINGTFVKE